MSAKKIKSDFISVGQVAQNRRASFDYYISERFTAGLELTGTEVKSLRLGHANITDAFGIEKGGELYISNIMSLSFFSIPFTLYFFISFKLIFFGVSA